VILQGKARTRRTPPGSPSAIGREPWEMKMREMKVVLLTALAAGTLAIAGCETSGNGPVGPAPDAGTDSSVTPDNGGGDTSVTPDTDEADNYNGGDGGTQTDTSQTDEGPAPDTCDCGDRVCGTAPSGNCSCGTCEAPEVCNPMGQCEAPGLPNGSYCGQTADCTAKIPDPANPGQEIDNPDFPQCIHDQCASKFCMGVGAPGVGVFNQSVCTRPCTISKDDDKDGVEDADAPFSDCDGFVAGPAGDSFRCVEFAPPSSGQTLQYCVATSDFSNCTANSDCPADEQCIGMFMYDHVEERCIARTQAGEWSPTTAKLGESCNEDPFEGDVQLCESGWCFGLGCVDSCNTDADCDTTKIYPDTGCDMAAGTCKTNSSWTCTTDADCSLWTCGLKDAQIFGDSIPYTDDFCWPRSCQFDSDCADGYYCRFNWNGAFDDDGQPVWEHMCLPQADGGVAMGEACDEDTSDNIPGDTCLNEDYCVGGYCGGLCQADDDCATDKGQQCVRVEFGAEDANGDQTTLPLDWCQTFQGSLNACWSEQDCDGDGSVSEHCELLTKPNGDPATSDDMPLQAQGVCTESDATLGGMATQCMSGADCESGWCLGADSQAGTPGFCTQMCASSADCEAVSDASGTYQGVCTSLLLSFGGDPKNASTNIYVGLCQFTTASLQDCSADFTCPDGEACQPNPIAYGPDFSTEIEYVCMGNAKADGTPADIAAGAACDPNAEDANGNPVAQCASGLCLDEAAGAADPGYCSQLCTGPSDDSCPTGLSCLEITTIPRSGAYADNAGSFFACMKDQDCTPCFTDGFCPGDRVCVNLGQDDGDLADYRCVAACGADGTCADGKACTDSTDGLGQPVKGCFDVDATSGYPTNFCTAAN